MDPDKKAGVDWRTFYFQSVASWDAKLKRERAEWENKKLNRNAAIGFLLVVNGMLIFYIILLVVTAS